MPRLTQLQSESSLVTVPGLDPATAYTSRLSARSALYTELHLLLEGERRTVLCRISKHRGSRKQGIATIGLIPEQALERVEEQIQTRRDRPTVFGIWSEWRRSGC